MSDDVGTEAKPLGFETLRLSVTLARAPEGNETVNDRASIPLLGKPLSLGKAKTMKGRL